MASGIARGRICTTTVTTATESHNMAAILCSIDMQPWFSMYFSNIGHPCYDQLTPVKTSTDQYHVAISWAQVYSSSRSSAGFQLDCVLRSG